MPAPDGRLAVQLGIEAAIVDVDDPRAPRLLHRSIRMVATTMATSGERLYVARSDWLSAWDLRAGSEPPELAGCWPVPVPEPKRATTSTDWLAMTTGPGRGALALFEFDGGVPRWRAAYGTEMFSRNQSAYHVALTPAVVGVSPMGLSESVFVSLPAIARVYLPALGQLMGDEPRARTTMPLQHTDTGDQSL
jgi:hypothetical protein